MQAESHYDILGVSPDVNQDKIHRAYTQLLRVLQSEPDTPETRSYLARAKLAYQVLSHPESRAAYHRQQEMDRPPTRTWAVQGEDRTHPALSIGFFTFLFGLPGLVITTLWAMFTRRKDTPHRD
jgi:DnaJ-class molecular chaperone